MYFKVALALIVTVVAADSINNFKTIDLFLGQHYHSGPIDGENALTMKCNICKYVFQYLCNTLFGNQSPTSSIFYGNLSIALEKTCEAVTQKLNLTLPADCPTLVEQYAMPGIVVIIPNVIAPNACSYLDSKCPEKILTC